MKPTTVFGPLTLAAACVLPAAALAVSTNPDTPTTLKVGTVVGHMVLGDMKTFENYYSFEAGPGTVRVRITFNSGPNAGQVDATLADAAGTQLTPASCAGNCNGNDVIASGQGEFTTTGTFQLDSKKTLVMHVHGQSIVYNAKQHPSYRITLNGDVNVNKTGKPIVVVNK